MAVKYVAGNRLIGTNSDRTGFTTTNLLSGSQWLETDTNDIYHWDGSSWDLVAGDTIAQTLTNKTLTSPTIGTSLLMAEDATIIFEGATASANETTLTVVDPTADRIVSLPNATDTLIGKATTDTLTNKTIVHASGGNSITGLVNASIANSAGIVNSKLAGPSIILSDGSNTSNIAHGATATFAATSNQTTVVQSSSTVTIGIATNPTFSGNVSVSGNLTVSGDTVTHNVGAVVIEDSILSLASANSANSIDIGWYGKYVASGTFYAGMFWDAGTGNFYARTAMTSEPSATWSGGSAAGINVGAITAAAITGTTIDATTNFTIGDTVITNGIITDSTGLSLAANVAVTGTIAANGQTLLSNNTITFQNTGAIGSITSKRNAAAAGAGLQFKTQNASDGDTTRMEITSGVNTAVMKFSDLNVGIGAGTVDKLLHVEGSTAELVKLESTATSTFTSGQGILTLFSTKARANPASSQEGPFIAFYQMADAVIRDVGFIGTVAGQYNATASNTTNRSHDMVFGVRSLSDGLVEKMRIDYSGNVGIGTTAPSYKFEVEDNGTSQAGIVKITQDDQNVYGLSIGNDSYATADGSGFVLMQYNNGDAYIRNSGSNRMVIDVDGKIGIGTVDPDALLHVYIGDSGVATPHAQSMVVFESNTNMALSMNVPDGNDTWIYFGRSGGGTNEGGIGYRDASDSTLRFKNVGNSILWHLTNNEFEFEQAATISTGAGILKLNGATELELQEGGTTKFYITSGNFLSYATGGPQLDYAASTRTNPTLLPSSSTTTTGIGKEKDALELSFITAGVERVRITAAAMAFQQETTVSTGVGALLLAPTTAVVIGGSPQTVSYRVFDGVPTMQVRGAAGSNAIDGAILISHNAENAYVSPGLLFLRGKGTAVGTNTALADNDHLGAIVWGGHEGDGNGAPRDGASIHAEINGTLADNRVPADIVFATVPDSAGSSAATGGVANSGRLERMRIDAAGNVGIGTASPSTYNTTGGKLVATSASGGIAALFSDSTYYTLGIKNAGSGLAVGMFGGTASTGLALMTDNVERMRIRTDGVIELKRADLAHGRTGQLATDVYVELQPYSNTDGGLFFEIAKGNSSNNATGPAFMLRATVQVDNTAKTTSAIAPYQFISGLQSSTTITAPGANANLLVIGGDTINTKFVFDEDGDFWYDGSLTTFADTLDDAQLVRTLDHVREEKGVKGLVRSKWDEYLRYKEADLIDAGILGDTLENGGLVSMTGLQRLHNGAIWQGYVRQQEMQERIELLEKKLAVLEAPK